MSLYKNKYRIESTRLKNYDYSQEGFYFVTICTKDRKLYFGDVVNKKMALSKIGKIADKYWAEIPNHFSHVKLDYYVVMPNHTHGILRIDYGDERLYDDVDNKKYNGKYPQMSKISPKQKSLSTIIRSYKSIVSKIVHTRYQEQNFVWQARFHDRIIRNDNELNRIRQYIIDNPKRWELDRNNTNDLYL